ncbi:ATP-binding protein [Streptomyces sp. 8N706]|uniref:ATP-binding protein n=1 Tax=Streptomyces sp. 8N706 TaxID=3457416 RepID=UPI003FD41D9C
MSSAIPPIEQSARLPAPPGTFAMSFTSSRRGARLARRLAVQRLDEWGLPYDSSASQAVALLVGELVANAVLHGHVPGRDFRLCLLAHPVGGDRRPETVRIEVSDARGEARPVLGGEEPGEEGSRGLLLVDALASKWGVTDRSIGKTVWCEYDVPACPWPGRRSRTIEGRDDSHHDDQSLSGCDEEVEPAACRVQVAQPATAGAVPQVGDVDAGVGQFHELADQPLYLGDETGR